MQDNKYIPREKSNKYRCVSNTNNKCSGSKCMAWKWTAHKTKRESRVVKTSYRDPQFESKTIKIHTKTHGCCGLVYVEHINTIDIEIAKQRETDFKA